LETTDHAAVVAGWNDRTLAEGKALYDSLCVACHGTRETPGSLPTALRFAEGVFKNGSDPESMFHTLTYGYGQMVPQNQYTTAQKYSVIQYIRETFLRPHNPSQFVAVTPAVLAHTGSGRAGRSNARAVSSDGFRPGALLDLPGRTGKHRPERHRHPSRRGAWWRQQGTGLDGLR
jgi:hypothetical protein